MEMSRLARDGTAEPVSQDHILRRERGQGNHEQDWQPYPADPYSCYMCGHTCTTVYEIWSTSYKIQDRKLRLASEAVRHVKMFLTVLCLCYTGTLKVVGSCQGGMGILLYPMVTWGRRRVLFSSGDALDSRKTICLRATCLLLVQLNRVYCTSPRSLAVVDWAIDHRH